MIHRLTYVGELIRRRVLVGWVLPDVYDVCTFDRHTSSVWGADSQGRVVHIGRLHPDVQEVAQVLLSDPRITTFTLARDYVEYSFGESAYQEYVDGEVKGLLDMLYSSIHVPA